jgi:ribosome-associated protein
LAAAIADDAEATLAADELSKIVLASLEDDKAEDVVVIDLTDKSSVTDAMIIASGRSQRHVSALADHVLRRLKEAGAGRVRAEGLAAADWVLIDAGDVIIHLFRPEVRAYYNLEKMWSESAVAARSPATATSG